MKKGLRWGVLVLVVALFGIQFIRPDRTNAPVDPSKEFAAQPGVDPSIAALLRRACYDCHSDETRWPWYSNLAPASWLVADDVHSGRRNVNFSIWGKYPPSRRSETFDDIHDQVSSGDMPLKKYLLLHPDAKLSQAERDSIVAWADREKQKLGLD